MNKKELINENLKLENENKDNNINLNNIIIKEELADKDPQFLYNKFLEFVSSNKNINNYSEEKINEINTFLEEIKKEKIIKVLYNYIKSEDEIINNFFEYIIKEISYDNNDEISDNKTIINDKYYFNIFSIINTIIIECLIYQNNKTKIKSEINNDFILYIFKFLINIINSYCNADTDNNKNKLVIIQKLKLLEIMSSIIVLLLNKDKNCILLDKENINILFQNMFKNIIVFKPFDIDKENKNIKKNKNIFDLDNDDDEEEDEEIIKENQNDNKENDENELKKIIIENFIEIICLFYKKYDLDSDELNYIHNNKFKKDCLIIIKNYIINIYIKINNIILMIDLIDLIIIYEDNKIEERKEKLFPLSYMEQLKLKYKNINTMDSFIIRNRIQNTINYLKNPNDIINKYKIFRVKNIFNDIEKIRLKFMNIINANNSEKIDKNSNNIIYNNKELRFCYEKIKYCFFYYFDRIYNKENNEEAKIFISLDDKKLILFDMTKIISLILSTKENILIVIKDNNNNIFELVIKILKDSITINDEFNEYCKEHLFIIFDKLTEDIKIINKENNFIYNIFETYVLDEYFWINQLILDLKNNNEKDLYKNLKKYYKMKIKTISRIISQFSKDNNFLIKNISKINYNSVNNILTLDNLDSSIVLNYLIILKNILFFQSENKAIITEEENKSIILSLNNIIENYFIEINIINEVILLIELKVEDEYFIRSLIEKGGLKKIIEIYNIIFDEKEEKEVLSKLYLRIIILINKLLQYNFSINEIINIDISKLTKNVKENIGNSTICENYLLIYLKIKNYLIENNINKEKINSLFSTETIYLIIEIFSNSLNHNKSKEIINNCLEILSYYIEMPSSYLILYKDNSDNSLIIYLFKSINIYLNEINIINYSIKILFRLFSQIKINKENNIVVLNLENQEDDLPEDLFLEESSDTSKIFNNDFFLNFINNNISTIIMLYYKDNKFGVIKNLIELIRIIIIIIQSEINHKNLLESFINIGEKFLNHIIEENVGKINDFVSDVYSLNLINHFSFLIFQLVSLDKEIIRKDFVSLLISINNFIKTFYMSYEIIKRYLNIIYLISTYSDKMEINKRIKIIIDILDNIKKHQELYNKEALSTNDKQIESIFLITKIIFSLKYFSLDLINNNLYFILLHFPKIEILSPNAKINYKEKDYIEFKENITELCSLYYIHSSREALNIINNIIHLINENISFIRKENNKNKIENSIGELIMLINLIKNLCNKTPYISEEIINNKKINLFFINGIKNFIIELNTKEYDAKNEELLDKYEELSDKYDELLDIINQEKEYKDTDEEKIIFENNKKIYLIGLTIGKENYEKIKEFLTKKYDVILYADETCFKKCTIHIDEDLDFLYATAKINDKIRIDSMKIDDIYKITNDNSNEAFDININKIKANKCFSLYSKYRKPNKDYCFEKDINIECFSEEFCSKYVKILSQLVELYKMMKE